MPRKLNHRNLVFLIVIALVIVIGGCSGCSGCGGSDPDDKGDGQEQDQGDSQFQDLFDQQMQDQLNQGQSPCPTGVPDCQQLLQTLQQPELQGAKIETDQGFTYEYLFSVAAGEDAVTYRVSLKGAEEFELASGSLSPWSTESAEQTHESDIEYNQICLALGDVSSCRQLVSSAVPQLQAIGDITIQQNDEFRLQLRAADSDCPDNGCLTFTADAPLINDNLNPQTGLISLTATQEDVGTLQVRISVEDDEGLKDFEDITVTVVDVNDVPRITTPDAITFMEDDPGFTLDLSVDDPDPDDQHRWSVSVPAANIQIEIHNDVAILKPNQDFNGQDSVFFKVSDGTAESEKRMSITVTDEPDAPILDPPLNSIFLDEDFGTRTFDLSGRIKDSDPLDVGQIQVTASTLDDADPIVRVAVVNNKVLVLRSVENAVGDTVVEVTVTDPGGLSTSQQFSVEITSRNDRPRLTGLPTLSITPTSPQVITLADFVTDPDDETIDLRWSFFGYLPLVIAFQPGGDVLTVSAPEGTPTGIATITIVVTDPHGGFDRGTIVVSIGASVP